jgi:hypothetical protein
MCVAKLCRVYRQIGTCLSGLAPTSSIPGCTYVPQFQEDKSCAARELGSCAAYSSNPDFRNLAQFMNLLACHIIKHYSADGSGAAGIMFFPAIFNLKTKS